MAMGDDDDDNDGNQEEIQSLQLMVLSSNKTETVLEKCWALNAR